MNNLDNISLLDLMIQDEQSAPSPFSASARWKTYSDEFVGFLRDVGLKDFRRGRYERGHPGHVLASFGAVDLNPDGPNSTPLELFHRARSCLSGKTAVMIDDLLPSRVGSPEGFEIDGRFYTLSWLNYYSRYAYASRFVDFSDQVIVEVGPGSGKQAEMLKKAHPDLTILLFDLPTQLYVCNQYLTNAIPNDVASYEECTPISTIRAIHKGKINILPHWKFPIVDGERFDLFWNAASLQEMAPETCEKYLGAISQAKALYLLYNIKYAGFTAYPGNRGLITPQHLPNHRERSRDLAQLALPPSSWLYFDSFWQSKKRTLWEKLVRKDPNILR